MQIKSTPQSWKFTIDNLFRSEVLFLECAGTGIPGIFNLAV